MSDAAVSDRAAIDEALSHACDKLLESQRILLTSHRPSTFSIVATSGI